MPNTTAQTKEPAGLAGILARAAALEARHGESMRALSNRLVGAARSAAFDPVTAGSAEQGQNAAGDSARQTSIGAGAHPSERRGRKPATDLEILQADAAQLGLTILAAAPGPAPSSSPGAAAPISSPAAQPAECAAAGEVERGGSAAGEALSGAGSSSAPTCIGHALGGVSTRGLRVQAVAAESSAAGLEGANLGVVSPSPDLSAAGGAAPVTTGDCADAASSPPPAAGGPSSGGQPLPFPARRRPPQGTRAEQDQRSVEIAERMAVLRAEGLERRRREDAECRARWERACRFDGELVAALPMARAGVCRPQTYLFAGGYR